MAAAFFLDTQLNGVVNVVGSAVIVICAVFGALFVFFARRANRAESFAPRRVQVDSPTRK
jgi:Ca2+/Na+ antiporter